MLTTALQAAISYFLAISTFVCLAMLINASRPARCAAKTACRTETIRITEFTRNGCITIRSASRVLPAKFDARLMALSLRCRPRANRLRRKSRERPQLQSHSAQTNATMDWARRLLNPSLTDDAKLPTAGLSHPLSLSPPGYNFAAGLPPSVSAAGFFERSHLPGYLRLASNCSFLQAYLQFNKISAQARVHARAQVL
jgi:hypothetical protein